MLNIRSAGIIGYGDFGKFLHELLSVHFPHIKVKVTSSRSTPDGQLFFPIEEVCGADVLFLAVPISAFQEVVEKILPYLGRQTIVCDISTVKKHTVSILRDCKVPRFVATHPMFGPYSYEKQRKSLKNLKITVCDDTLSPKEHSLAVKFFRGMGLNVLEMTPDDHDRLVAETLFLTHLVGQIVKRGKFERTSIDTISFGFLMDATESVAHDDVLFREVFTYNPYCKEVLSRFESVEKQVAESLVF